MSLLTCVHSVSTSYYAYVISTNPSSPHGVGALTPPIIFGATNAITLCTTPSAIAGAANVPPHSHKHYKYPRLKQYCATASGVKKSNSTTSTPWSRNRAWKSRLAPRCVITMVGATVMSHKLAVSGRSSVRDMTTRTGRWPPSWRVVSRGLSRRTVCPPTITTLERARV